MSDGNNQNICNASFESIHDENINFPHIADDFSMHSTVTEHHQSQRQPVKESGLKESQRNSLELKIKMLNDVGVFKKKSPMASGSIKYFTNNEEIVEYYAVNATAINMKSKEKKPLAIADDGPHFADHMTRLYLKFDLDQDQMGGILIFARDPLFQQVLLQLDTYDLRYVKQSQSSQLLMILVSKNGIMKYRVGLAIQSCL